MQNYSFGFPRNFSNCLAMSIVCYIHIRIVPSRFAAGADLFVPRIGVAPGLGEVAFCLEGTDNGGALLSCVVSKISGVTLLIRLLRNSAKTWCSVVGFAGSTLN